MKSIDLHTSTDVSLPVVPATAAVPAYGIAGPLTSAEDQPHVNLESENAGLDNQRDQPGLLSQVNGFDTISLAGMENAKAQLMSRIESKYLMTLAQCQKLVHVLADSYSVLEIQGAKIGRYVTIYYDTPSFLSYHEHHNGKKNRFKLRMRHYDSSDETYLEVKKKNNKGQTDKCRMKTVWSPGGFLPEQVEFLQSALPLECQTFRPVVRTVYNRITFVSKNAPERITLDTGIVFDDGRHTISYPDLVIGEIKHEKGIKNTPALLAIHAGGIRKGSFSKYCTGVSLLYDELKHNHFKETLLCLASLDCRGGMPC
jgi:hypothetical protein